jgi:hypothetical protein
MTVWSPVVNVIKGFFFVTNGKANQDSAFDPSKFFQDCPIFLGRHSLTFIYQTKMKKIARGKCSSLFCLIVGNEEKTFYKI